MFECGTLTWSSSNARTLRLHKANDLFVNTENNKITSLCDINGEILIEVGGNVAYKKTKYKVNIIEAVNNQPFTYDLKTAELNASSIFLPPLIWSSRNQIFWDSYFVNAFLGTDNYNDCIALLYKFSGGKKFATFEDSIVSSTYYVASQDIDAFHTLYILNVPQMSKEPYNKYVQGKYSEIPEHWKKRILEFHSYTKNGATGQVLYKSKKLRKKLEKKLNVNLGDMEVRSIPDLNIERFNLDYYKI